MDTVLLEPLPVAVVSDSAGTDTNNNERALVPVGSCKEKFGPLLRKSILTESENPAPRARNAMTAESATMTHSCLGPSAENHQIAAGARNDMNSLEAQSSSNDTARFMAAVFGNPSQLITPGLPVRAVGAQLPAPSLCTSRAPNSSKALRAPQEPVPGTPPRSATFSFLSEIHREQERLLEDNIDIADSSGFIPLSTFERFLLEERIPREAVVAVLDEKEFDIFQAVVNSNGNLEDAARLLQSDMELVEDFLEKYDKDHFIWKKYPNLFNQVQNHLTANEEPDEDPPLKKARLHRNRADKPMNKTIFRTGWAPFKRSSSTILLDEEQEKLKAIIEKKPIIAIDELHEIIINKLPKYISRGVSIPIGLRRFPFHLELPEELNLFTIQPTVGLQLPVQPTYNYNRNYCAYFNSRADRKTDLTTIMTEFILLGPDYQVQLDDEPSSTLSTLEPEREELMWSAADANEHFKENQSDLDKFYDLVQDKYMFPIWVQFESHIPPEFALQNLQKNKFDIPNSLDTVDQYLKVLPQKMKPICNAQAQLLKGCIDNEEVGMRQIQETMMRNYHLGEIVNYHFKFRQFCGHDRDDNKAVVLPGGSDKSCGASPIAKKLAELKFEPRYGCSNCTKNFEIPPTKLCLICQTYASITKKARPANDVVFDGEELEKIRLWERKEVEKKSMLSREQFEDLVRQETTQRHRKLELTQEETLMLDYEKLVDGGTLGEQVANQLRPFDLPPFLIRHRQ